MKAGYATIKTSKRKDCVKMKKVFVLVCVFLMIGLPVYSQSYDEYDSSSEQSVSCIIKNQIENNFKQLEIELTDNYQREVT